MIGDYFTKPVQGGQFKKLRDHIMGITMFPIEERVRENAEKIKKEQKTKKIAIENRLNIDHKKKKSKTYDGDSVKMTRVF